MVPADSIVGTENEGLNHVRLQIKLEWMADARTCTALHSSIIFLFLS